MDSVILMRILLAHPQKENTGAEMNFVFDAQPTVDDIMHAYAAEPYWAKNEDRDIYGTLLRQCLQTYGVPRLHELRLVDAESYIKGVPMVEARWLCNIVGRNESIAGAEFGGIRVTLKAISKATPQKKEGQAPVEDDEDEDDEGDEDAYPVKKSRVASFTTRKASADKLRVGDLVVQIDKEKLSRPLRVKSNDPDSGPVFDRRRKIGLSQTFHVAVVPINNPPRKP